MSPYSLQNLLLDAPRLDHESMLGPVVRMRWMNNLCRLALLEELDRHRSENGEYVEHDAEIRRLRRMSMHPSVGRFYLVEGKINRILKNIEPEQARQIVDHWLARQPMPQGAGRSSVEGPSLGQPDDGDESDTEYDPPDRYAESEYADAGQLDDEYDDGRRTTEPDSRVDGRISIADPELVEREPVEGLIRSSEHPGVHCVGRPVWSHDRQDHAPHAGPALPALSSAEGSAVEGPSDSVGQRHDSWVPPEPAFPAPASSSGSCTPRLIDASTFFKRQTRNTKPKPQSRRKRWATDALVIVLAALLIAAAAVLLVRPITCGLPFSQAPPLPIFCNPHPPPALPALPALSAVEGSSAEGSAVEGSAVEGPANTKHCRPVSVPRAPLAPGNVIGIG